MSQVFWQSKIWGLLHDPILKSLHNNSGRGGNSFWGNLVVMQDWVENQLDPEISQGKALSHIHLADYIASASDRGAIGVISRSINYGTNGLEISHLLSGKRLSFRLKDEPHQKINEPKRSIFLDAIEESLLPAEIQQQEDIKTVFWWLWRCLPLQVCQQFSQDKSLLLMPAETRLPDSSIWNHASITAALAGALTGYDLPPDELKHWSGQSELSHPYLAAFSFTPVQELIKASRKMRDFWAGSWILHYLSAKVCWALAWKYGPDSFIYPNLFQQPLIDVWLLEQFPQFEPWIDQPSVRQMLTAGFPNVLILLLPKDKVSAAMQFAEATLKQEWQRLGGLVFDKLTDERKWMQNLRDLSNLTQDHKTWNGWLSQQWQVYWSAVALGKEGEEFKCAAIPESQNQEFQKWLTAQNQAFAVTNQDTRLFQDSELAFLREAYKLRLERQNRKFSVNIGSWWPYIFSKTRSALAGVKNSRTWELPTAFSVRSSLSGLGPAVHPGTDQLSEGSVKALWARHAGLFSGSEQLNATETVKRGLHKILNQLLPLTEEQQNEIDTAYPDLTAGVAGYLKAHQSDPDHLKHFQRVCRKITEQLPQGSIEINQRWGIPWIDELASLDTRRYHSRFLNAGWLAEEVQHPVAEQLEDQIRQESDDSIKSQLRQELAQLHKSIRSNIQVVLDQSYPWNNPSDWYALAAGDGDDLNQWLRGSKLNFYEDYIPSALMPLLSEKTEQDQALKQAFAQFLQQRKRMGPSTHSALSRALLDFSNQLVPYLTEQRYAGRLIYGGGDDVLAYTNLWEWDQWLWDIRQCFKGEADPKEEFTNRGDYWQWRGETTPESLDSRPLFTMGRKATISFGVVIAHHSVPLAIALEHLWDAENAAKKHISSNNKAKDAAQVRVIYGNGNTLKATAKFEAFHQWQMLLTAVSGLEPALFEQAAQIWGQHPVPDEAGIPVWTQAFCDRRDFFGNQEDVQERFRQTLENFLSHLWQSTADKHNSASGGSRRDLEIQNWLKLAAFVLRKRQIKLPNQVSGGQA